MARKGFNTRSDAAKAAQRELGEGKLFRTTQNADGDWSWHYEPGAHVGLGFQTVQALDFVAWVEVDWNREGALPHAVPVAVVTCRLDEVDQMPSHFRIEPITPELFELHNPFAKPEPKARRASTGERERSGVESPTKLVWQLAGEMVGATRAEVVAACVERGVHPSTAATQYYRWQRSRKATST
jgi:hypothetical protein